LRNAYHAQAALSVRLRNALGTLCCQLASATATPIRQASAASPTRGLPLPWCPRRSRLPRGAGSGFPRTSLFWRLLGVPLTEPQVRCATNQFQENRQSRPTLPPGTLPERSSVLCTANAHAGPYKFIVVSPAFSRTRPCRNAPGTLWERPVRNLAACILVCWQPRPSPTCRWERLLPSPLRWSRAPDGMRASEATAWLEPSSMSRLRPAPIAFKDVRRIQEILGCANHRRRPPTCGRSRRRRLRALPPNSIYALQRPPTQQEQSE
jgi:hypothetical protein